MAARLLYIHYNTMKHRMVRIEELLDVDLHNPRIRLSLAVALAARVDVQRLLARLTSQRLRGRRCQASRRVGRGDHGAVGAPAFTAVASQSTTVRSGRMRCGRAYCARCFYNWRTLTTLVPTPCGAEALALARRVCCALR